MKKRRKAGAFSFYEGMWGSVPVGQHGIVASSAGGAVVLVSENRLITIYFDVHKATRSNAMLYSRVGITFPQWDEVAYNLLLVG